MYVRSVRLADFRNYERAEVEFGSGVNIIYGKNAQGKTNLLESIYLCGIGRSARTTKDKELIRWGASGAHVGVEVEKKAGRERVDVWLSSRENKRIQINGLPILRIGELMGTVCCIYFSPDELKIVKEGPTERRRFMDIDICQLSQNYFFTLNRYNKIIGQRNRLLKSGKDVEGTLGIWDTQLCREGARIIKSRRGFAAKLLPHAVRAHAELTGGREELELEYRSTEGGSVDEIYGRLMEECERERARDIALGYTHAGPHKDDILLKVNGKELRTFGSQGQQRTAALSLKLAELEIFAEILGEYPVLLLDDVLSELDAQRQEMLLERASRLQTIITAAIDITSLNGNRYLINNGTIS